MKYLENLKLDEWWKFLLVLGVGAVFSSFYFQLRFIQNGHLLGLGFGMLMIGISFWIAEKHFSAIKPPNVYTGSTALVKWKETRHNAFSYALLALGIVLSLFFGYLIIRNLI